MKPVVTEFENRLETIKGWRHHLHTHPELSFEEEKTARYIADLVKSWGYEVVEGIGKHGVVASLTAGKGKKSIGLRADTDALPIQEDNELPYKSEVPGVAHLCGHDGHSTMLLAAGEYLARTRNFNGTVRLIFQPAEEIMGGGPAQGTYCLLGNGDTPMVHHPKYVFNDDILAVGAAYWVALTEQYLSGP